MLLDTIAFQATAPGASAAAAAVPGDSLTIKNALAGSDVSLITFCGFQNLGGYQQITAPSFSDTTRGIRGVLATGIALPIIPIGIYQSLQAQETLSVTLSGSAVVGQIEQGWAAVWYANLPGQDGRYLTEAEVDAKTVRFVTVQATINAGITGGWSGSELITSESDLLRANTDYALLGITTNVGCAAVGVRAPDWANSRVAVPGMSTRNDYTSAWFSRLSNFTGYPCIPVFNSANKNNIFIDVLANQTGPVVGVALMLVELTA
jgi:hypothetical protein